MTCALRGWGRACLGPITALPLSPLPGFLDWVPKKMQRVGCVELLNTVQRRVQPRLHVFGHIHEGQRGRGPHTWLLLLFSCSVMSDSLQPHRLQHTRPPCPSLSSRSLLKVTSIKLVMPSNHLIICYPLLLLPSICPSIRVFSNELALPITCPKWWSFNFSISPFNEYSGLVSFRVDWFDHTLAGEGHFTGLSEGPSWLP